VEERGVQSFLEQAATLILTQTLTSDKLEAIIKEALDEAYE